MKFILLEKISLNINNNDKIQNDKQNEKEKSNFNDIFKEYFIEEEKKTPAPFSSRSQIKTNDFDKIKEMKDNIKKSIKIKGNRKKNNKIKFQGIQNEYLNILSIDKSNDSCFDDDLFFLKEIETDKKVNKKLFKLEERRKYRLIRRKSKKIIHKIKLSTKKKKNPFLISIDEYLDTK